MSISKSRKTRKLTPCSGERKILVGEHGMRVKLDMTMPPPKHLDGVTRGKITQFSAGAARRLREALFSKSLATEHKTFGLTLTVPWHAETFEPLMEEWRATFRRFQISFLRRFPNSAAIYRNELQKRGAPHIHAVVYLSMLDISTLDISTLDGIRIILQLEFTRLWTRAVKKLYGGSRQHFIVHGIKLDELDPSNCGNLYRYLADHASKHKQDQLGYMGKQWGYINRTKLASRSVETLPPFDNSKHEAIFWRMIKKLTRYRLDHSLGSKWSDTHPLKSAAHPELWHLKGCWKRSPPFDSVYKGGHRRLGVIFTAGGADTVRKCYDFASALSRERMAALDRLE